MSVRVLSERLNDGEISPFQCGQFIEFLCDLVPGMYSEMVYDNSFEGLLPYKREFIRQKDFREEPWYPSGAVHRGEYKLDSENPFNGKVSLRIEALSNGSCTLGISQDGMYLRRGQTYLFSCFLRQEGMSGPVIVSLVGNSKSCAQQRLTNVKDRWGKFTARLIPVSSCENATLRIQFQSPRTLWIDKVSLMPKDNVGGWRRDVVRAVRALRPSIIRFGGSTVESYEWMEGIGDPDLRVPFTTVWGGLEPNNVGLEEFVEFCRTVGSEPLICVRYTDKTPQDAANQVEYFNGPVNTPFGRRRAAKGHPKMYGIKYWQIGNEVEGPQYERDLPAFCEAMRNVDPKIRLLSSYPTRELIRNAGAYLDYVCPHQYGCDNLELVEDHIQRISRDLKEFVPKRKVKIAVTEWNTTGGDWGLGRNSLWTLENALLCARYHNVIQRHCDIVEIAIRSNLTNSFCSGIIQTRRGNLFKTPTYYVQQLYSHHSGLWPLRIESKIPSDRLDISVSISGSGRKVHLLAVNTSLEEIPVKFDFSIFNGIRDKIDIWTVIDTESKGERDAVNNLEDPQRIRTIKSRIAVKIPFEYMFEPLTVNALECQLTKAVREIFRRIV